MSDLNPSKSEFLTELIETVEKNISNEQFGVTELADSMNMSRSNLLRKVKHETKLSVSQLINQVRLKRAMELLRKSSFNVSEVSHEVGFSSTSYFIKCFREYYGYPPGEVGKRKEQTLEPGFKPESKKTRNFVLIALAALVLLSTVGWFIYNQNQRPTPSPDKSIAVLPFKNDSNDSTNVYLINGLMESTLNNLQKIKDLKVVSRTSSEKYRTTTKSIPEMAKELNVNYFVVGSGQKIGDRILLNVQLIDALTDRHLWSKQYRRESSDIFELQQELAIKIATEIQAIITPEEAKRIEKIYTKDLAAYDLFLKGQNLTAKRGRENLLKGISFYNEAIARDEEFALAYAEIAITYYYLDIFQENKTHGEDIATNADKALLYDSKLGEALVAKAISYIYKKEYEAAEPYLEKALEYNPNSAQVIGFLSDYYSTYNLNTAKYLEHALKGIQLDIAAQDSITASYTYLRLSNALIQTGFVDEALVNMDKALAYNPQNPFARYIRAFILYAKNGDLKQTQQILIEEYTKDSTRFDILQDIGKVTYYMGDFKGAYKYYKEFLEIREKSKLDAYRHENMIIGAVLDKVGLKKESDALIKSYKEFLESDHSIYRNLGYSYYYTYQGDQQKAVEYIKLFAQEDNVQYWIILFLDSDPILISMMDNPEFKKQFEIVKARFWKTHETLKVKLQDKGLLL